MRSISVLLILLSVASPVFAASETQSNTTSASATSSPSNPSGSSGSGSSAALGVGIGLGALLGVAALASLGVGAPAAATKAALAGSFGGRIVAAVPCLSPEGPSIWVTIIPFGIFPATYIWTPLTLSVLVPPTPSVPPTHPTQQILGTYLRAPYACTVGIYSFYGFRMITENVSRF